MNPSDLPASPPWLDHHNIQADMLSAPGRISEAGRRLAGARYDYAMAKAAREREEAMLYQMARAELAGAKVDGKGPTEAQVNAFVRTDPRYAARYGAAIMNEAQAEAVYEVSRSDYTAILKETDLLMEAARNSRAEMGHLDPTVRTGQIGRSYPRPSDQERFVFESHPVRKGYHCRVCLGEVRATPSGYVCKQGHGGTEVPVDDGPQPV